MKKDTLYILLASFILIAGSIAIFLIDALALLIYIAVTFAILIPTYLYFKKLQENNYRYVNNITDKIKDSADKGYNRFPIGIIIIDSDKKKIEWANNYVYNEMKLEQIIGESITEVIPNIKSIFEKEETSTDIEIEDKIYTTSYQKDSGYLYFFDVTENKKLKEEIEDTRPALMVINIDNQEEIYDSLDDEKASILDANITSILADWAKKNNIYLKKIDEDRFLSLVNLRNLKNIEEEKFHILDQIRNLKDVYESQVTISIGVAVGADNLPELGEFAKKSLDIALARGGDQVAVKEIDGSIRFYGGKTDPQEKRTRVKARVISNALSEIIKDSENIVVMGHTKPDFDSLGSCVGIFEFSQFNGKDAYIVLNEEDKDETISKIMDKIEDSKHFEGIFVSSKEVEKYISPSTTLVVVDTSDPDRVLSPELLEKIDKKVIIDHHRRGEEIIETALLTYIEPYASSASELISELLEYESKGKRMEALSATLMLGGIVVDSQNFTLRTGSRTFDAAAYLRSQGADPIKIKTILKEPLENFLAKTEIINRAYKISDDIIISVAPEDKVYNNVTLAQSADSLLTIKGIEASFVVGRLEEDLLGVSARSLGNLNVQLVMEEFGGGGHLTNAACQINSSNIQVLESGLIRVIREKIM